MQLGVPRANLGGKRHGTWQCRQLEILAFAIVVFGFDIWGTGIRFRFIRQQNQITWKLSVVQPSGAMPERGNPNTAKRRIHQLNNSAVLNICIVASCKIGMQRREPRMDWCSNFHNIFEPWLVG